MLSLINALMFYIRRTIRFSKISLKYKKIFLFFVLTKLFPFSFLNFKISHVEDNELIKASKRKNKHSVGWAHSKKKLEFKVIGKTLGVFQIKDPEEVNIHHFYFSRSLKPFINSLKVLKKRGIKLNLNYKSIVFEPGCNVGKILSYFSDKYRCKILGIDIFEPSISAAKKTSISKKERFISKNLVESNFLRVFTNSHFDLILLSSHLVHIKHHELGLRSYLKELQRISKQIIFFEKKDNDLLLIAKNLNFELLEMHDFVVGIYNSEDL